jgi:adenylate cyclase
MKQEIERKFLVRGDFRPHAVASEKIVQGYLSTVPERSVRVRRKGEKGFLTIKGMSNESGTSRLEWETEISPDDADKLFRICESGIIDKTRYQVPEKGGLTFEVDVFSGENEGLIMAEIELPSEGHPFTKPEWLGEEVTGDKRYYNISLMKNPFKSWE